MYNTQSASGAVQPPSYIVTYHRHRNSTECGETDRNRLTACYSRTTWYSNTRKVKANLDFNETRDDGVAVPSAGQYANHLHLTPCRQITTPAPHHSIFYRPDALPNAQPTVSKHWRQLLTYLQWNTNKKSYVIWSIELVLESTLMSTVHWDSLFTATNIAL